MNKDFVSLRWNRKQAIKQQAIKLETPKMDLSTVWFITPVYKPHAYRLLMIAINVNKVTSHPIKNLNI